MKVCAFDKTGTLTHDGLDFYGFQRVAERNNASGGGEQQQQLVKPRS